MRKVAVVTLSVIIAAGLCWAAAPGGASVAEKNTRFCTAVSKLGGSGATAGGRLSRKNALADAKALRKASKSAPRKIKRAMNTLAGFYDSVAKGKSYRDVLANNAAAYSQAALTFGTYLAQQCGNSSVPTT
jgi:hypothetical protein